MNSDFTAILIIQEEQEKRLREQRFESARLNYIRCNFVECVDCKNLNKKTKYCKRRKKTIYDINQKIRCSDFFPEEKSNIFLLLNNLASIA